MQNKYVAHRRSKKYIQPTGYVTHGPYAFAERFHYDGYDEIEKRNFFGPMWCEAENIFLNEDDDYKIVVRCWYTATTPNPSALRRYPDVVIEVNLDHNKRGCFPYFWINQDALEWNAKLRDHLLLKKKAA